MSAGMTGRSNGGPWPSVSDYNEAVQNLHVSMGDAELRGGTAVPGITGLPMPYAGGFADVYKVDCPATGSTWALKFFKREIRGLRERYRAISEHLSRASLPFMVDFGYLDEGVRIGGRWYPIVKLRWVEGLTLSQYVGESLDQPRMLDQLVGLWVKLASRLRGAQIAHADLQHGNVMLVPRGDQGNLLLRLIDYDGMWVPALAGRPSGEVGHRHFQHPRRAADNVYSAQVDRFSHLAICCALRCLSIGGRQLWERFDNGDNLLFSESDFTSPGTSALFRELWTIRHPDARALVGRLALATQRPLDQTPWIDELVIDGRVRPLPNDELRAAQVLLEPSATVRALPVARPLPAQPAATTVAPVAQEAGPTGGAADPALSVPGEPAPIVLRTSGSRRGTTRRAPSLRALIQVIDGWLAHLADGPEQHQVLRTVACSALVLALALAGLSVRWLTSREDQELKESTQVRSAAKGEGEMIGQPSATPTPTTTSVSPKPSGSSPTLATVSFTAAEAQQYQQAWAEHLGLLAEKTIELSGNETLALILIPPGEFEREEVNRKYRVRLTQPFYLGKYEVTQAQWQAVMGSNPSIFKDSPTNPVEQVDWNDVQEFLKKLNDSGSSRQLRLDLPTEAQWEFACRAGTTSVFSFGDNEAELARYAWFNGNSQGKTHPVGQLNPNPFGLYDLHGNVWEWCSDWYEENYYAQAPQDDPRGPSEGSRRAGRGGGWSHPAAFCRTALRSPGPPTNRLRNLGFRVAAVLTTPQLPLASEAEWARQVAAIDVELLKQYAGPQWHAAQQTADAAKRAAAAGQATDAAVGYRTAIEQLSQAVATSVGTMAGAVDAELKKPDTAAADALLRKIEKLQPSEPRLAAWKQRARELLTPTTTTPVGDSFTSSIGMRFQRIEAGQFDMGAADGDGDERPIHRVTISRDFYLGVHEVTQRQYQVVMGMSPSNVPGDDRPVERLSWYDAVEFCRRLAARDLGTLPAGFTYRLPTEAEWEFAARAGTNLRWPSGDSDATLRDHAWYEVNSRGSGERPVGQVKPNAWGLFDMHGNVWEFCQDWYGGSYYAQSPAVDPPGPASGAKKVLRGGSWLRNSGESRTANRNQINPQDRSIDVGFRVALGASASVPNAEVANRSEPLTADSFTSSIGLRLQRVPTGSFNMGSNDGETNERRVHRVWITYPLYLGIHEVTQAQYRAMMNNNPSKNAGDDLPVEEVTWNETQEFCRRLTERDRDRLPVRWAYRLPTEAEWEHAARAGTGTRWCFGDNASDLAAYAWYSATSTGKTHMVGQKRPNAWGFHDMYGNVWEWCQDAYDGQSDFGKGNARVDPKPGQNGPFAIIRGGSLVHGPDVNRSATRGRAMRGDSDPDSKGGDRGFRIALSAVSPWP